MSEGELVEAAQNVRVPVATIASLCELTPTRIYQLSSQGVRPGIVDSLLPLGATLAAYIAFLRGFSDVEGAGGSTFASERTRLFRLRADAAELDKQVRMGLLARRSTRSSRPKSSRPKSSRPRSSRPGKRTPTIFAPALGEEPSRSLFADWWLQSFRRGCRLTSL